MITGKALKNIGLGGLGHLSSIFTVIPFLQDLFEKSDQEVLIERFDRIDSQFEEIKYLLKDVNSLIIEQKVILILILILI